MLERWRAHPRIERRQDVTLGVSVWPRNADSTVIFPESLRPQHLGILGLSGSGKTHFLEHMIRQDIRNQMGFVVFDVHGDLAESLVGYLAEWALDHPEVYERTVLIEPFDTEQSVGFNPLERRSNSSPHLQAQELGAMLHQHWNEENSGSPRTEELLRNSLYALAWNDSTLVQLPRLLTDREFRNGYVQKLPSGSAKDYFIDRFDRLSESLQRVYAEPVLSRISAFIADPQIREILGQARSTFSFRQAITDGQWVIINLARGRLGENSSTLGRLFFSKLELDVMSLADIPEPKRRLFGIYADELQNLAGSTFGRLVAEARKYRVGLVAGHQFWKQLEPSLRQGMLAVGSKAFFRLHYQDAVELAGDVSVRERQRFINLLTILDRGEAVVRLGAGQPALITIPAHKSSQPAVEHVQKLRAESAARFTRKRSIEDANNATNQAEAVQRNRGNEA